MNSGVVVHALFSPPSGKAEINPPVFRALPVVAKKFGGNVNTVTSGNQLLLHYKYVRFFLKKGILKQFSGQKSKKFENLQKKSKKKDAPGKLGRLSQTLSRACVRIHL